MATQTGFYPKLSDVMDTVRLYLNDWQAGATGTPGEGQITTNNPTLSPQTLVALNSAIREVYRELRIIGAPSLIKDNVQVALPANAVNGPTIQTYLSFTGYYDGAVLQPTPTLPADMMYPLVLWEQQTGQGLPFVPMVQSQEGLPSPFQQGFALQYWEWRGGASFTPGTGGGDGLFFVGALCPITIRLRYKAALTQFVSPVDFTTTYIPILDCEEAVAYKIAAKVNAAIGGPADTASLVSNAAEAMRLLKNEQVLRQQTVTYTRTAYAEEMGLGGYTTNSNLI